tara:strand:+ start:424 stop:582 length:159 start_codon:yes stop_codon:yes gene_type:complete
MKERELLLQFWDFICENSIADRSEYTEEDQQKEIDRFMLGIYTEQLHKNDNP